MKICIEMRKRASARLHKKPARRHQITTATIQHVNMLLSGWINVFVCDYKSATCCFSMYVCVCKQIFCAIVVVVVVVVVIFRQIENFVFYYLFLNLTLFFSSNIEKNDISFTIWLYFILKVKQQKNCKTKPNSWTLQWFNWVKPGLILLLLLLLFVPPPFYYKINHQHLNNLILLFIRIPKQ